MKYTAKEIFTAIYERNSWMCNESRSGNGSTVKFTKPIREQLPNIINKYNIKTILDAPCGDFNWMQHVELNDVKYIGVDIVDEIIEYCKNVHGKYNREFLVGDITEMKLPKSDLIICKDCFIHLPNSDIYKIINNFKSSGAKYIMISDYPLNKNNIDVEQVWPGGRELNMSIPPFNLPEPIETITLYSGYYENYSGLLKITMPLWDLNKIF